MPDNRPASISPANVVGLVVAVLLLMIYFSITQNDNNRLSAADTPKKRTGINVRPYELEKVFKDVGFQFENAVPVNGLPRIMGNPKNQDHIALVEIIGKSSVISKASFCAFPNEYNSSQLASYGLLFSRKLISNEYDQQWITKSLATISQKGKAEIVSNGVRITLNRIDLGEGARGICLSVANIE